MINVLTPDLSRLSTIDILLVIPCKLLPSLYNMGFKIPSNFECALLLGQAGCTIEDILVLILLCIICTKKHKSCARASFLYVTWLAVSIVFTLILISDHSPDLYYNLIMCYPCCNKNLSSVP
jgi:hypothetical protein